MECKQRRDGRRRRRQGRKQTKRKYRAHEGESGVKRTSEEEWSEKICDEEAEKDLNLIHTTIGKIVAEYNGLRLQGVIERKSDMHL